MFCTVAAGFVMLQIRQRVGFRVWVGTIGLDYCCRVNWNVTTGQMANLAGSGSASTVHTVQCNDVARVKGISLIIVPIFKLHLFSFSHCLFLHSRMNMRPYLVA
jgi:hypothetical protein